MMERVREKKCACSGIRSCLLCERLQNISNTENVRGNGIVVGDNTETRISRYTFCLNCQIAWLEQTECGCSNHTGNRKLLPGVYVFENFISPEEEQNLCEEIDKTEWVNSQSGRRKQDYGPRVNFKKRKLKTSVFTGLPGFTKTFVERFKSIPELNDFKPIELCHIEYVPERGSSIDPHFDDFWLWGPRLITLNLLSTSVLTFTKDSEIGVAIDVPMPARSLIVVSGDSRYEWKHSIERQNIASRRIACTFRELSTEFTSGENKEIGDALFETALSYKGTAVS